MSLYLNRYLKKPNATGQIDPTIRRRSAIASLLPTLQNNGTHQTGRARVEQAPPTKVHQSISFGSSQLGAMKSLSAPITPLPDLLLMVEIANASTNKEIKKQYLNVILSQIVDTPKNSTSLNNIVQSIFQLFEANVLRSNLNLPPEILFADTKFPISAPNWDELKLIYHIMILTLKNIPIHITQPFITYEFIEKLIEMLKTPDPQEQATVEVMLSFIFDHIPTTKTFIFERFLRMISLYLNNCDNSYNYNSIISVLKFYLAFLKTVATPLKPSYIVLYKNYFAPLFVKPFATEYLSQLISISTFFGQQDPNIALWTLNYLLMHWPITDSGKETMFLANMPLLVQHIPPILLRNESVKLFKTIVCSIKSPNFKVCQAALSICSNAAFMSQFSQSSSTVIGILAHPLKDVGKHWDSESRNLGLEAIRNMYNLNNKAMTQIMISGKEEEENNISVCSNWAEVVKIAKKNDNSIDIERIKEKLEDFLNAVRT